MKASGRTVSLMDVELTRTRTGTGMKGSRRTGSETGTVLTFLAMGGSTMGSTRRTSGKERESSTFRTAHGKVGGVLCVEREEGVYLGGNPVGQHYYYGKDNKLQKIRNYDEGGHLLNEKEVK